MECHDPRVEHMRDWRHLYSRRWRTYWTKRDMAAHVAQVNAYTFEQEVIVMAKPKPNKKSGHRSSTRTARALNAQEPIRAIRGEHTAYDVHEDVFPRHQVVKPGTSLGNRAVIGTSHYVPERAPRVKA